MSVVLAALSIAATTVTVLLFSLKVEPPDEGQRQARVLPAVSGLPWMRRVTVADVVASVPRPLAGSEKSLTENVFPRPPDRG